MSLGHYDLSLPFRLALSDFSRKHVFIERPGSELELFPHNKFGFHCCYCTNVPILRHHKANG